MKERFLPIGMLLLLVAVITLLLATLMWIFGGAVNPFIFPLSILLANVSTFFLAKVYNVKDFFLKISLPSLIIIALSLGIAAICPDYSYDGQSYHAAGINALKNGWNPVRNVHDSGTGAVALWVEHYPKGFESIAATIYSSFNNIECGKALNFILVISSFFFVYILIKFYFKHFSAVKLLFFALIITLSPVVINQILTYYVDWGVYSLILILLSVLLLPEVENRRYLLLTICSVLILGISLKFTTIIYLAISILVFEGWLLKIKKSKLFIKVMVVSAFCVVACLFTNVYNPYITNTIAHAHPLYPLAGKGAVDILGNETPVNMRNDNRLTAIVISLFSYPSLDMNKPVKFAMPLTITKTGILDSGMPDVRVGGFGNFFSAILILSIIIYLFSKVESKEKRNVFNLLIVTILIGIMILPAGWWSRYIPFFYLFPIVMLLYSEYSGIVPKWVVICRKIAYILLTVNILINSMVACLLCIRQKVKTDYYLEVLQNTPNKKIYFGVNTSFKIKVQSKRINYVESENEKDLQLLPVSPNVYTNLTQADFDKVPKSFIFKLTTHK